GLARSERAANAKEVAASMRVGMGVLAAMCLLCGFLPTYVVHALGPVANQLGGSGGAQALVPPFFAPTTLPSAFVAEFHDLGAQTAASMMPPPGLVLMHRGGSANPVVFASAPSYLAVALGAAVLLLWLVVRLSARKRKRQRRAAWAGGLHRLLPEFT